MYSAPYVFLILQALLEADEAVDSKNTETFLFRKAESLVFPQQVYSPYVFTFVLYHKTVFLLLGSMQHFWETDIW